MTNELLVQNIVAAMMNKYYLEQNFGLSIKSGHFSFCILFFYEFEILFLFFIRYNLFYIMSLIIIIY